MGGLKKQYKKCMLIRKGGKSERAGYSRREMTAATAYCFTGEGNKTGLNIGNL